MGISVSIAFDMRLLALKKAKDGIERNQNKLPPKVTSPEQINCSSVHKESRQHMVWLLSGENRRTRKRKTIPSNSLVTKTFASSKPVSCDPNIFGDTLRNW